MSEIVLTTINAKYIHSAFGLRYLLANLGDLQQNAEIMEFDLQVRPVDIAEAILRKNPRIVGVGVYIWNAIESCRLVSVLKSVRPQTVVVIGGPEVSYEWTEQEIFHRCDYLICGEADLEFPKLCRQILNGRAPACKVINSGVPDLFSVVQPYDFYTEEDIKHRIIYVESSRGCPFKCEFCLSSLDIPVRYFPLDCFLDNLKRLIERGARQIKFVDRTFNISPKHGRAILEFCLEQYKPGMFYHFEIVPDKIPEDWFDLIRKFPEGSLQFEIGIQTFNSEVSERIERRQNYERVERVLKYLRNETGVHLHTDLIAGLPGESYESFAKGFDKLVSLNPQEIQVGILKRLRGTPIVKHDQQFDMVYNPFPPYEILRNKHLSFEDIQRIKRFARYWDIVANSGNFIETIQLILGKSNNIEPDSALKGSKFAEFMAFSDWLFLKVGRTDSIARTRLIELIFQYLTKQKGISEVIVAEKLINDCLRSGHKEVPPLLRSFLREKTKAEKYPRSGLKRQLKHLKE